MPEAAPPQMRFDDRVAIITGAGAGIGRAHSLLLASRGATVVVNDVDSDAAKAVVAEIEAAGGRAIAAAGSVASSDAAASVAGRAVDEFGRVDILVNNAGILRSAELVDHDEDMWNAVIGVTLTGTYLMSRAVWPAMVEQGYGRVVNTTSNSGLLGTAGSASYSSAKAGLWGLTRTLAIEGAAHGIHVNAIAPMAYTAMSSTSRIAPAKWRSGEGDEWSNRLKPEFVSPAVAWLAHEECPLNGEVLSSAGGRVARFFLGLTFGFADDDITIESVRDHLDEIISEDGYDVLAKSFDEGRKLHRRLLG